MKRLFAAAKNYAQFDLAILCQTVHSEGGDWRSAYFLAKSLEMEGKRIALFRPKAKGALRKTLATFFFAPRVLVNSLSTLSVWSVLILCILRKDTAIYLHETDYMLDDFEENAPRRYRLLSRIMRENPILCVSEQAETLYRKRFQSKNTTVVYECTGQSPEASLINNSCTNIVMVGSINERKGVDLFSRVADISKANQLDWQFHWVGNIATENEIYMSDNVIWHGWHWDPNIIVNQCDVFFLSSIDDPCPLSALEALQLGKRTVAFEKTGIAEIIAKLSGCCVFRSYSAEEAMKALTKALEDTHEVESIKARSREISGIDSFTPRVMQSFASPSN